MKIVLVEYGEQIGFTASPNASDDFRQTVILSFYESIKVKVTLDLYGYSELCLHVAYIRNICL